MKEIVVAAAVLIGAAVAILVLAMRRAARAMREGPPKRPFSN
jgi:hypothetical protein